MYKGSIFKEQPIRLLYFEESSKKFEVNQEAITIIKQIKGPLAIISITGAHRSGKSYLLNRMLLNRPKGFPVNIIPKKQLKGLWIWGKPILGQSSNAETISILLIDKHQFAQNEIDQKLNIMQIFLSSILIYNSIGEMEKIQSQKLSELLNQVNDIYIKNEEMNCLPQFYWIIRDSYQVRSKKQIISSSKQILDNIFTKNQKLACVNKGIKHKQCIKLIKPVNDQKKLENLDSLDYQLLSPDFVDQIIQARRKILNKIISKTMKGKVLDGETWIYMLNSISMEFSKQQQPSLSNIWNFICVQQCEKVMKQVLQGYEHKYRQITFSKRPISQESLKNAHKSAKRYSIQMMKKKCIKNEELGTYLQKLKNEIHVYYEQICEQNKKQNLEVTKQFLLYEYQTIQRKIKTKQIKQFQDYKKEFTIFQQFFKKKGNNSLVAKQYYHEFMLKKSFEAATLIIGYLTQQFQEKKNNLNENNKKLEVELKQIKRLHYKEKVVLQNKIDKLTQQQNQLIQKNSNLQQSINEIKTQKDHFQKLMSDEISKQKLQQSRIGQDLKNKLNLSKTQVEQLSRSNFLLESQLKKKEILFEKSFENYSNLIEQYKINEIKLKNQIQQLKNLSETEKKLAAYKFQLKNKQNTQILNDLNIKLTENQQTISNLNKQIYQLESSYKNQLLEKKQKIQELTNTKIQLELQLKIYQQKIQQTQLKTQRLGQKSEQVQRMQQQTKKLSDQIKNERSEKQKIKAILQQKLNFIEIQNAEERKKSKIKQDTYIKIIRTHENQKIKLLEQQKVSNLQKEQMMNSIKLFQTKQSELNQQILLLNKRINQKQEQINLINLNYKEKQDQHQLAKSTLVEQLKINDLEKLRLLKLNEQRSNQQIYMLKEQIEQLKINYENQIEQIKKNTDQSLRQLKNFHSLQKQRIENRLLQQKAKNEKRTQNNESETAKKLRQLNHRYQEEIFQLKRKMWELEKTYKIQINKLEYELSEKKQQVQISKQKIVQLNSRQQYLSAEISNEKIDLLQSNLKQKDNALQIIKNQKQKLEQLLIQKQQQFKQLKQTQQIRIIQKDLTIQTLIARNESMSQQLQNKKKEILTKTEGLITENLYLIGKVNRLSEQNQESLKKIQQYQIKNQNNKFQYMRNKLMEAQNEIRKIEEKYQKARKYLNQIEFQHSKELNKIQTEKSILQSHIELLQKQSKTKFKY